MEMPRPGLKMREKNKNIRLAMDKACADETTKNAQEKLDHEKDKRRLAALEDKMHNEDVSNAKTANHPPARLPAFTDGEDSGDVEEEPGPEDAKGDSPDSGHESEQYAPLSGDESGEDSDPEPEESEADESTQKKQKKKSGFTRAGIATFRTTRDGSGTPAVPANDTKKRKAIKERGGKLKKPKISKKGGLTKPKPGLSALGADDDDSMVAPGGPALDDDMVEDVERPRGKKKKGIPNTKQLLGGSAKWTLKHLPSGTSSQFTDEVVPLAGELAGSQLEPWTKLTVKQVQDIIDKVYGKGEYIVEASGPWMSLAVQGLIDAYESNDEEDTDEDETNKDGSNENPVNADANSSAGDAATAETAPPAKIRKFRLNTREGVRAFIDFAYEPNAGTDTMAFHWKTWGNGVNKKGLLQSYLILHVFAYHLVYLEGVPGGYGRLESPPESALLLAEQAVRHELKYWRTCEYINPNKTSDCFSVENCGDIIETVQTAQGKKKKLTRRVTKFQSAVRKWDKSRWMEVTEGAKEFMEQPSRKRGRTTSRSGSEVGDDVLISDDEVMILSD
ncbi:hypothetical protein B0H13DRAFT_2327803 [Mycena leptocephala]|nr:hypothetical protein B0H13DRAFT_2327803 [Mycena leptocephala]